MIAIIFIEFVVLEAAAILTAWGTGYALTGEANPFKWKFIKRGGKK